MSPSIAEFRDAIVKVLDEYNYRTRRKNFIHIDVDPRLSANDEIFIKKHNELKSKVTIMPLPALDYSMSIQIFNEEDTEE